MRVSGIAARVLSTRAGQKVKQPLRHAVERLGYDLVPLERDPVRRFADLLTSTGCASLVDVGANQGQYAQRARLLGFTGDILSLEPGRESFSLLERNAARDPTWHVRAMAAGRSATRQTLNVSRNSVSSSLLAVNRTHVAAAPESTVAHGETVEVDTLDTVTADVEGPLWLKIDTQGFEMEVLGGASHALDRTEIVHIELSMVPLYEAQADYLEVLALLGGRGFDVIDLEPGLRSPESGNLLQCDAVLRRRRQG